MTAPKWKAGASHSWWAIVPSDGDTLHPLPWFMASTRAGAWARWRTRLPSADPRHYTAVKVVMAVAV